MCNKTKNKNKKHSSKCCLQCFSSEKVLQEHREICLKINGKQNLKLKSGSIKFKIHFKQFQNPFSKEFKVMIKIMLYTLKKIRIIFLAVMLTKLFVLMINLGSQLFFAEHFNKNLIISPKDEERFQ